MATPGGKALEGLLAFPLTPFGDDLEHPALDILDKHVRQLVDAGPRAVFVACGTGEFTALSLQEYAEVVHTAVAAVDHAVPVFAGVGGGPGVARDFARTAAESGADGALLLPPYLVQATPAGLLRHIAFVAAATPLPLVVYQRGTALLDAPSAVRLLDEPRVVGIKDGYGDLERLQRIVAAIRTSGHPRAEDMVVLNGMPTAELSAQAYAGLGVRGYSSAVLDFAPDIATAFHAALTRGHRATVNLLLAEFYLPFAALRDLVPGYAVSLVKAGARTGGLPVGGVRPPLVDPEPAHVEALTDVVARGRAALRMITGGGVP